MSCQIWYYGDLAVTVTKQYSWCWNDKGTGGKYDGAYYHPKPQGEMCALGSLVFNGYGDPTDKRGTILVGPNPNANKGNKPAVARPTGYTKIWFDTGSGGAYDAGLWRPNAPDGYVSLGDVMQGNYNQPKPELVWCVRSDLVKKATYTADRIWDTTGEKVKTPMSSWDVVHEKQGYVSSRYVPVITECFRANASYSKPDVGLAYSLLLDVESNYKKVDAPAPSVTQDTLPYVGDRYERPPQRECSITLPFMSFFGAKDTRSLANISSPFITVGRYVSWFTEGVYTNYSDSDLQRSKTLAFGFTDNEKEELSKSVFVDVAADNGIRLSRLEISLEYQFADKDYRKEYAQKTDTMTFALPARKAVVLFTKHITLRATRACTNTVLAQIETAANDTRATSSCTLS